MKFKVIIMFVVVLMLLTTINVFAISVSDYMITDETIISNAPTWYNSDFPTYYLFYNESDNKYYVATSKSCCGYEINSDIDVYYDVFKLGDSEFRLYSYNNSEWRDMRYVNELDMKDYILVSYSESVSDVSYSNLYLYNFKQMLKRFDASLSTIDYSYLFKGVLKAFPVLFTILLSLLGIRKSIGFTMSILGVY